METIDKGELLQCLVARLAEELHTMEAAQRSTAEGVMHEESRAENDKDTRGLESSYLARGQAERVLDLRDGLAKLQGLRLRAFGDDSPVALGALVSMESDDESRHYFLVPAGGGERLRVNGLEVLVVTPSSPVGRALLGAALGDDVSLRTPSGVTQWSVVGVE